MENSMEKYMEMYREGFHVLTMAVYENHIYCGTVFNPENVHAAFLTDIARMKPVYVGNNTSRVYITLRDADRMIWYTLPLEYQKYINREA